MVESRKWKTCLVLFDFIVRISASTHWIVTENGKIQSQLDSVFHMRRPYDLLSLLDQEKRVKEAEALYKELMIRKNSIDQRWGTLEGAADLESKLYSQDPDCLKAGHTLADSDFYVSLISDIRERIKFENYLITSEDGLPEIPDCSGVVDLDFSMSCFEHLQVMVRRANLSTGPELSLASFVSEDQETSQFAHQVALGLQRNTSSWLHHNLAAVYWRIHGNAPNAMECARRAVHFAPRQFKDMALRTLGGLLQQAKALVEAALVLHAAVDHAPMRPQNHLALGAVYTILGDHNRSVACLDNALRLDPSLDTASKLKHTVRCHHKLEKGLLDMQQSVQTMLGELGALQEYHGRQEQWLRLLERLRQEQAPLPHPSKLLSLLKAVGSSCVHLAGAGPGGSCEPPGPSAFPWQAHSLQLLLRKVESRAKKMSEQMLHRGPLAQEPSAEVEGAGRGQVWPSVEECAAYAHQFPSVHSLSSVFLAPEEKGFEAHLYLGRLIGLRGDQEHPLPWVPPACAVPSEGAEDPLVRSLFAHTAGTKPDPEAQLLPELLKYGVQSQATEAEVGQRILTAIGKDVGPRWLLHSLAALFWRVRGNVANALDCLRVALASAPPRLRDVPLVSIGALLLRSGRLQAAQKAAREALKVEGDGDQVAAHFLLGLALEAAQNHSGAVHHLQRALDGQPGLLGGQARNLLRAAACHQRFPGAPPSSHSNSEEMCDSGEAKSPTASLLSSLEGMREGDTVVCSVDGQQCFSHAHDAGSAVALDAASMARFMTPGEQCANEDGGAGKQAFPDETELERMADSSSALPRHLKLQLAMGEERQCSSLPSELYVPVAFMVYEKSGTYALSPSECAHVHSIDWDQESAAWLSAAGGGVTVGALPAPLEGGALPECDASLPPSPLSLDHLAGVRLRRGLHAPADAHLQRWLANALGHAPGTSSPHELAARLAAALQENATSWVLATAAALYWRVVGRADQAVTCLRQALQYAPSADRNVPLVSLASVLSRAGFYSDALVVANMALDLAPKFFVAHFTIANIHASMGDLERAIFFYRSSLELEPNFEPARNRLLAILCSDFFEDHNKKDG